MESILECNKVTKNYGNKIAVNNVSLNIPAGKIIGLLGPNGSGKTTLIKMISGVLTRDAGEIKIAGNPIGVKSKSLVSYLPERPYFPTSMKVRETIEFFEMFYEDFDCGRAYEMFRALHIDINMKLSKLSKGNKEKVQLILVMSRRAKLYLLDEPMGGVDPATRDFIIKTIINNYDQNASVVISTHLIRDVENVLDNVIFIKNGVICLDKTVDEIRMENHESVDEYFREVFAC